MLWIQSTNSPRKKTPQLWSFLSSYISLNVFNTSFYSNPDTPFLTHTHRRSHTWSHIEKTCPRARLLGTSSNSHAWRGGTIFRCRWCFMCKAKKQTYTSETLGSQDRVCSNQARHQLSWTRVPSPSPGLCEIHKQTFRITYSNTLTNKNTYTHILTGCF